MEEDPLENCIGEIVCSAESNSLADFKRNYAEKVLANQIPLGILLEVCDRSE